MTPALDICVLGAATSPHVVARAKVFQRLGHKVTLVSPVAAASDVGVPVIAPKSGSGFLSRILRPLSVLRLLLGRKADIFHAHYAAELTSWAAFILAKRPLVVSVMGGDVLFNEQGALGPVGRGLTVATLRAADLVTVKSRMLSDVVGRMGVAGERILPVVWGVDREQFRPDQPAGAALRRQWGVAEDRVVLFSPRMLQRLYNQHVMVEALALLPQAHLVMSTFREDDAYGAEVRAAAARLGVLDRIAFIPGRALENMAPAYSAADIVLSLSSSDGFPQTVLEAMACGVPVVLSNLDRYREHFADRQSAMFVSIDAAAVAGAVSELMADDGLRRSIIDNAGAIVARDCDFVSQARLVEAELFRLAAQSRAS